MARIYPIGTIIIPTKIVDKAGLVSVDNPHKQIVEPDEKSLEKLREVLCAFWNKLRGRKDSLCAMCSSQHQTTLKS